MVVFQVSRSVCWRAMPANQAMYAARSADLGVDSDLVMDELLPRGYKIVYCEGECCNVRKISHLPFVQEISGTNKLHLADPANSLNHIYKFGWCTKDAVQKNFFRKSVNVTLPTYQDTQLTFIYLLERKHTVKHLQCVIMKAYVPQKFLFLNTRLPLYYCQGTVFVLMMNTINRYDIHEFYLSHKLNMPMNFVFEFYHPYAI